MASVHTLMVSLVVHADQVLSINQCDIVVHRAHDAIANVVFIINTEQLIK